jgi:hypothetical protein
MTTLEQLYTSATTVQREASADIDERNLTLKPEQMKHIQVMNVCLFVFTKLVAILGVIICSSVRNTSILPLPIA